MTHTGIQVPHFHVIRRNIKLGLKAGLVGLVPVTIGNFCLNYTSIPLYLAFRKCALLSSVMVMYFWAGDKPSKGVLFSTGIVTVGALIAACEDFSGNVVGFVFVWVYNFSQSYQNVYISVLNKDNILTPFEFNFFGVCIGLVVTVVYNFIITSDYEQFTEYYTDPQF